MKIKYNYKIVLLGITVLFGLALYVLTVNTENNSVNESPFALHITKQDSTWIYEVYNKESLFIRQVYIPAVKGKQGFKTKEDAEKIGNLVIRKLSENKMPVISMTDLYTNAINFEKN
ncbi:DUF4907 domain-containing protein [Winogradskyella sediminis]|uniref:DUF4907 domain-containing protein n=1 Tax=Winogradskyella sediminis TaxID=1382466 RepID=UPI000E22CF8B|nr:DUF4907 domain-containing protein [Winogradskyella sediminis]REG87417.1 uncharacterized protein DUF4907 [Winogradskyella sediminis]